MLFNQTRATDYMRHCGLDALIATSWANLTYFTDYYNWIDPLFKEYMMAPGASDSLGQGYAVFPLQGDPAFIVGPLAVINGADSWVQAVYTYGDTGLDLTLPPPALKPKYQRLYASLTRPALGATSTEALLALLQQRGLTNARIGVELDGLTPPARAALAGALPHADVRDASNLLRLIRAVKSPEEIDRLTRSAAINEQVALEGLAHARPGTVMADLARHYRTGIAALGAEHDHYSYSIHGLGIAGDPLAHTLTESDVMFVDFGCLYGRYFSDTGMTLALRPLAPPFAERHAALRECMTAGMEAVRPGVTGSTVYAAMRDALTARGYTAINPHGHGLGVEIRDYPILIADRGRRLKDDCIDLPADVPLEVDMVFNLESAIFLPGHGAVHIERTFIVTPGGLRPLIEQDRSGPIIPDWN